jgi:ABC-type bacteriocin/lantibiotic exporter with double-glycine peptidase domain
MKYIRFYRHLLPYWKKEVLIWLLGAAAFLLGLVNPYLTKIIIDKAFVNKNPKLFIALVILAGVIFILDNIMNTLALYLSRFVKLHMSFDLNLKIFKKLQYLSYRFFQDTSTGDHLYKIAYDIERVAQFICDIIPQIIFVIPKSLFIFGIVLYLNAKVALFSLLLMPFLYLVPYFFTRRLKKVIKIWVENAQHIFEKAQEIFSHMQLIKVSGRERRQTIKYIAGLIRNTRLNLSNIKLELTGSFTGNISYRVILGLIIGYGAYQVLKGKMTLGTLCSIALYLNQLSSLQHTLTYSLQQISLGLISCERLNIMLDAKGDLKEDKLARDFIFSQGTLVFKDITFGYNPDKMVLKNLSFCIEGGSCVGLVGPSGCGKTTIINLVLRLYKPLKGQITIDGADINLIKSKPFYKQIGVVLQEPFLWNDTIENNIRYEREKATFKEIKEAANIACIDDFVNGLEDGYKTVIGENACKISEGQKQRIAIARALIKKPKILILDEALSSIDAELESRIIDNIRNLLRDSTIIVISHRLSTISKTNAVYFLAAPDKIEVAAHESLLRNNPQYPHYLAHQLQ